jgi:hypothetical protein
LNNIRSAMEGIPRLSQPLPEAKSHWDFLPAIDWFWVKVGIKAGLAAVISVVLLKWINPPGSASIPIMAWELTVLGRPFVRAGGTGDLRAIQTAFHASLILAVCAALVILIAPFLADYAVMNVALFLILFTFGFLTWQISGINFWILLAYITLSAFVGLNPQKPVASQTIIDTFLGITFGMFIGTVSGRLLWPVLPQRLLRDSLLAVLARIKALLDGDAHREKIQIQLAIPPVEALQAAHQIRIAGCSREERANLVALIRALQTLIARITQLVSRRNILPETTATILRPQFERLELEFKQTLDAFAECFRQGDGRRHFQTVSGALAKMNDLVEKLRQRRIFAGQTVEAPLRMLDLLDQYHSTAGALDECGRLLRNLQIQGYWGDYGL